MSTAFDPSGSPEPAERGVTAGEVFELLSNQRRRHVVRALSAGTGDTELRPLSREVAALENEKPPADVTPEERRRVYNALQQFHLPKLDEAGALDYDQRRGTVSSTDGLSRLEAYLGIPQRGQRWCRHSLAAGAAAGLLVAALLVATSVPALTAAGAAVPLLVAAGAVGLLIADRPDR